MKKITGLEGTGVVVKSIIHSVWVPEFSKPLAKLAFLSAVPEIYCAVEDQAAGS